MGLEGWMLALKNGLPSVCTLWSRHLWLLWVSRTSSTKDLHTLCSYFQYTVVYSAITAHFSKLTGLVAKHPVKGGVPGTTRACLILGWAEGWHCSWGWHVSHWHPKMPLLLGDGAKSLPCSSWGSTVFIFPCVKQFFRAQNHCTTHESTGVADKWK